MLRQKFDNGRTETAAAADVCRAGGQPHYGAHDVSRG
jgi:hypothetical protein